MAVRQENASQNSVMLFWHEPAQPNGVILEYDIKYYEKVMCEHTKVLKEWYLFINWADLVNYTNGLMAGHIL